MIQLVLEIIAFQLVFIVVYDLFLKKETFFQWNRAYLLISFILSFIFPFIKVEALKFVIPVENISYPDSWWNAMTIDLIENPQSEPFIWEFLNPLVSIFLAGSLLMAFWFINKLCRIWKLKINGTVSHKSEYTKIEIKKSTIAFSFFNQLFIGENLPEERLEPIIAHELVHIKHWHSVDLLCFELMRIPMWFNPVLYLYQSRMAELHEFIADSITAKRDQKLQYQLLLSEVFETKKISFINQFFQKSLIKKRIVMLSKEKSTQINLLKYLALFPLALIMLVYTSCETEEKRKEDLNSTEYKAEENTQLIPFMEVQKPPTFPGCENSQDPRSCFIAEIQNHVRKHFNYPEEAQKLGIQGRVSVMFTVDRNGDVVNVQKRGPHILLENEVDRIIKRLPKMQPGEHQDKFVDVPFSLPIVFKLK